MKTKSEFRVVKWEDVNCGEPVNNMLTSRASVVYEMSGGINGKMDVEYLLHSTNYNVDDPHKAVATYIGFMTFSGSMDEKSGTFVLEDSGVYSPAGPVSKLVIKPDTGTGDFNGITGSGKYFADGEKMIIEIEYLI